MTRVRQGWTPGPWRVISGSVGFATGVYGARTNDADSNWIADTEVGNELEREANARLIAAAPALFNALTSLVASLETRLTAKRNDAEAWDILNKARAALKLARGGD